MSFSNSILFYRYLCEVCITNCFKHFLIRFPHDQNTSLYSSWLCQQILIRWTHTNISDCCCPGVAWSCSRSCWSCRKRASAESCWRDCSWARAAATGYSAAGQPVDSRSQSSHTSWRRSKMGMYIARAKVGRLAPRSCASRMSRPSKMRWQAMN